MRWTVFFKAAVSALRANVLRSFLTMLSIVIGIAAIVIVFSVGYGAQSLVANQINTLGSDLIGVLPGASDDTGPPASVLGISITTLKRSDAEAMAKLPGFAAVSGYVKGVGTISAGNQSQETTFTGVSPDYTIVESVDMAQGHFFTSEDDNSLSTVVVLGWQVYKDLFGEQDAVGQLVRLKRQAFRVIGVVEERGTEAFQNQDNQVFIPLQTAQKILLGIDHLAFIRAKVEPGYNINFLEEDARLLLRDRHDIQRPEDDDFSVRNTAQALDILSSVTEALKYFLAAISAISLLVGGIGIMNIMLVSVLERTQEIGLRKAVGARAGDLRLQFLIETVFIALLGGIVGLILGILISYGIAVGVRAFGYYWEYSIGLTSIVLSVLFPIITGLIFGYYPATKAAKLDPIESLRYE